jgi:hypothetical protein
MNDSNTTTIRDLLNAALDDEALNTLCFDHFRPVYDQFSVGMSRTDKIQRLVEHAERFVQIPQLLTQVRALNPAQYALFAARLSLPETDHPLPPYVSQSPIPKGHNVSNLRSLASNPFFYGARSTPELFYGRRDLLQAIVERVGGRTAQSISIVGERRMGKTSLLHYLKAQAGELFPSHLSLIIIYLDLMQAKCHTRRGLMQTLRRELTRAWREPWPAANDGDLGAFDFALEDLQAEGIRLLLCLDEVENLTGRAAEFSEVLEDWRACGSTGQVALITASAQPLADLCASGGLTSPFYNIFEQRWLGLLTQAEWQALVTDNMAVTPEDLAFIEKVAGGQPFFTQMAANYLWTAKVKGEVNYDPLYQELWAQIEPHVKHQWTKLSPDEQATLRRLAAPGDLRPEPRPLAALERRGLVRQGRPFSRLFAEMIVGGYV